MNTSNALNPINILLADDDSDDRYFFERALKAIPFSTKLETAEDGEYLMTYLSENLKTLPDILFLDHNMPRKNGLECLVDIRSKPELKELPIIIYSTHVEDDMADIFYEKGAHFYMRKTIQKELNSVLNHILVQFIERKTIVRPPRNRFVLSADTIMKSNR